MAARQGAGGPRPGSRAVQEGRLEARQVRAMFDRISGVYDLLNTAMTAGLHHRWRERAADEARVGPGSRVLDVATGTGDLALELAGRVAPGGEVIGSDFAEGMLDRARAKAESAGSGRRPALRMGRRAGAPLRGRLLRRRHGRLRSEELRRSRPGPARDGARRAPRRARRGARDHDADEAAAVASSTAFGSIASCRRSASLRGASRHAARRESRVGE